MQANPKGKQRVRTSSIDIKGEPQVLKQMLRKRHEDEKGFTLIELMVVVLIIAILIAIAIPTFLGARKKAQDRAAQSNLRNALTAEKTFYTDAQTYTATAASLTAIEPSLGYVSTTGTMAVTGNKVFVSVASGAVTLGAHSASGTCYWIHDDAASATGYLSNNCSVVPTTGWAQSW
jgi:type IV pilus assembly protein PilA